ncbi:MAG: M1 family metallopeptidase [Desulfobacterales bacterium]|nr:M1 family metallopeptidase [Desulfobacterales bacterium]
MSHIHPIRYAIHITPDLEQYRFDGQVAIELLADRPVDTIALHLLELAIWKCRLRDGESWTDLVFSVDTAKESLAIRLPAPRSGRIDLCIDYQGLINDKMAGFYRSQTSHGGRTFRLAVTQFQESSARQAFPCMDHPLHKAVFDLTMSVPAHLTALANTLPVSEEKLDGGRKRIVFGPTPLMSTYLLFFGVAEFELAQDGEDPRVRLAHLPGMAHTAGLGLEFGRKALRYCEEYYAIPYPLPKLDLIAVPDFAFGAMENWGAITFRENLLLHFPELTSKAGIQRICEVIAHEIAHQWFGNLVTPSDWKYLWLNESFATYFGFGVVAHYHPDWGIWDQFLLTETATALVRDGLRDTIAIEIPGGEHVVINSSTAPIIYNKGGSILRMIQGYIGAEAYQQGVRGYLKQHQYACAESRHLWEAFEQASAQPITAMMQSWIGQPGHPLITASRKKDTLTLRQKRFTYIEMPGEQTWIVPLTLTSWNAGGQQHTQALMMQTPTAMVALPPQTVAYKLNNDQTGFYRVQYNDGKNLDALGRRVADGSLSPEDRWGLQNDLYALVRQGQVPLGDYLAFLDKYYLEEKAFLPLASSAGHLFQALLVAPEAGRVPIAALGRELAGKVLARIGLRPAEGEPHTTAILRDQLLWQGAVWGLDSAVDFGQDQFQRLTAGQRVHPDIAKAVAQIGAWTHGPMALAWFRRRYETSPSEHERLNILAALGAFRTWELTAEALAFSLDGVPPRNRFIPIVAATANPLNQAHLWDWYQKSRSQLESIHPLLYERVITAIVPSGGLDREAEVQHFFESYTQSHPNLVDAVRLALEHLAINGRMRAALK